MVESKTLQPSIFRVSMCKIIIHNLVVVVSREVGRKLTSICLTPNRSIHGLQRTPKEAHVIGWNLVWIRIDGILSMGRVAEAWSLAI